MAGSDPRDEGFLARWSRRKAKESQSPEPPAAPDPPVEPTPQETDVGADPAADPAPDPAAEPLPDPETLGRDADWSRFLRADVPPALRTRALRRLWRLDPVYANLDGLLDYAEDYNDPAVFGRPVKTLYQVGRGIFAAAEPEAAEPASAARTDAEPAGEAAAAPEPAPQESGEESGEKAGDATAAAASDEREESPARPSSADTPPSEEAPPQPSPPAARRGRGVLARRWGGARPGDERN